MVAVGDAVIAITSLYSLFSQSTNPLNLKASFNVCHFLAGGWVAFFAESISNRILLNRIFQIILFKMELTTNKKQSFFLKWSHLQNGVKIDILHDSHSKFTGIPTSSCARD